MPFFQLIPLLRQGFKGYIKNEDDSRTFVEVKNKIFYINNKPVESIPVSFLDYNDWFVEGKTRRQKCIY